MAAAGRGTRKSTQNRPLVPPKSQNFLRTRFRRCAPALAASVQNRPPRARNRKIFFGLAPALRACARRPRPAATDGWREAPTPQSVRTAYCTLGRGFNTFSCGGLGFESPSSAPRVPQAANPLLSHGGDLRRATERRLSRYPFCDHL